MNFIEEFIKGQQGKNFGLSTGLPKFDKAIGGIQRKAIYGVAASPKAGKTTFVDQCFVIEPYLYHINNKEKNLDIDWIYFSFEIDRIKKEFKYAASFFYRDYGLSEFTYNDNVYEISSNYLLGKMQDDLGNIIPVSTTHKEILKEIYYNKIVPLFGEYDKGGKKIKAGAIDFIEEKNNPTGIRNYLLNYAKNNGEFIFEEYEIVENGVKIKKKRISGYKPKNPDKYTIVILDHIRKMNYERGFSMKENIDKMLSYQCELRNWCGFTFIDVAHMNRSLANTERIKFMAEQLYPTGDDIKDSGNLSEDCDFLITLFNPQDEKYNIKKHFGLDLENYPKYRSIHLVESRDTECPIHLRSNMYGNINLFKQI
jgi:hypothetical protein